MSVAPEDPLFGYKWWGGVEESRICGIAEAAPSWVEEEGFVAPRPSQIGSSVLYMPT